MRFSISSIASVDRGRVITDHCAAVCTLLAVLALSFTGVGNAASVCAIGAVLCVAGLTTKDIRLDLWVFVPLLVYIVLGLIGSYRAYGTITEGYACVQAVLLAVYLLISALSDDEARMLRRACVLWALLIAFVGILWFVGSAAFMGEIARLERPLGNANALGVFLVVAWFALLGLKSEGRLDDVLRRLEPILLAGLGLTLSLGSFVSLCAGLIVSLVCSARGRTREDVLSRTCVLLVKLALGVGCGILLYFACAWGDALWFCAPLLAYLAALSFWWNELDAFLKAHFRTSALLALLGPIVAVAAVMARPSSLATFAERLAMMRNGIGYLANDPLMGTGPYRWRYLNLADADTYFNTWHIHNAFIHVSVELGLLAGLMLVAIAVRYFLKRHTPEQRGGFTAFLVHNLMDTSFFYPGIGAMTMVVAGSPRTSGVRIDGAGAKALFSTFGVAFAVMALCCSGALR